MWALDLQAGPGVVFPTLKDYPLAIARHIDIPKLCNCSNVHVCAFSPMRDLYFLVCSSAAGAGNMTGALRAGRKLLYQVAEMGNHAGIDNPW